MMNKRLDWNNMIWYTVSFFVLVSLFSCVVFNIFGFVLIIKGLKKGAGLEKFLTSSSIVNSYYFVDHPQLAVISI